MKLIIAGGRDFNNYTLLEQETQRFILDCLEKQPSLPRVQIISGTAKGADKLGEKFAKKWKFNIIEVPANWEDLEATPCKIATRKDGTKYNLLAGLSRNEEMAKIATHCIVFWDQKSSGSRNMIENAKKYDLILKVISY